VRDRISPEGNLSKDEALECLAKLEKSPTAAGM